MSSHDVENSPLVNKARDTRLVRNNKFRIKRHNVNAVRFAQDPFHTLMSLHGFWIFAILVAAYVP